MAQNQAVSKKRTAVIGGGPAGVMAAITASENPLNEIFVFDKSDLLKTLLPTGGGRCNLAYNECDFKELSKNYPRGGKFLYSVFSRFCTDDTIDFFDKIGVKTYTQSDSRIFPVSDSSEEVRNAMLKHLKRVKFKKEKVLGVKKSEKGFLIKTNINEYLMDSVIISTGGRGTGQNIAKDFGHNIKELRPALTSLKINESFLFELSGLSIKNVEANVEFDEKKILYGDLLFTHFGISGPLAYKISSYFAYCNFSKENPLKITLNLIGMNFKDFDKKLIYDLEKNSKKDILNVVSLYVPRHLAEVILRHLKIDSTLKASQINKSQRENISKILTGLVIKAWDVSRGEEVVTAGGIDLDEVNPKTMESKLVKNLYFCGEILDIDGLTGGFNLQNCWSTGYIAGKSV